MRIALALILPVLLGAASVNLPAVDPFADPQLPPDYWRFHHLPSERTCEKVFLSCTDDCNHLRETEGAVGSWTLRNRLHEAERVQKVWWAVWWLQWPRSTPDDVSTWAAFLQREAGDDVLDTGRLPWPPSLR